MIDRSLELDDRFLEARLDRSRYLAAMGRQDEAIQEIGTLLEENGDNPWVALRYVEVVELPAGDYRPAEGRLRAVLSRNPFLVEAWVMLGRVFVSEGRSAEAVAVYREATSYRPDDADLQARLALLLAEINDPTAETALREAIRSSPAVRADLHVSLGERLAARGHRDQARQQFEIAAEAQAFSAGNRNSRGMALLRLGRTAEAEALWGDLIRDRPEYGRAWLNLSSLSIQRRDWPAVERFARAAVEREPRSPSAWNNLGIGLEELGRTAEAEAAYRRALADSDDPMKFDVPQLNNVYESAPYLHDGKAATLEEIWTRYNDYDEHGVANDMTKDELNDLVEYLKSIGDADYYMDEAKVYEASVSKKNKQ